MYYVIIFILIFVIWKLLPLAAFGKTIASDLSFKRWVEKTTDSYNQRPYIRPEEWCGERRIWPPDAETLRAERLAANPYPHAWARSDTGAMCVCLACLKYVTDIEIAIDKNILTDSRCKINRNFKE